MARDRNNLSYTESNARPSSDQDSDDMIQQNSNLDSATTQKQNANPGMSREQAFNEVTKVPQEVLKRDYIKNKDGSYTHKSK